MRNIKFNLRRLSLELTPLTYCWAIAILLSAFFARQLLNLGRSQISPQFGKFAAIALFISAAICLVGWLRKVSFARLLVVGIVFFIGVMISLQLDMYEERVHLLEYGILGMLLQRDAIRSRVYFTALVTLGLGIVVGTLDEGIQALLPYRVGDPRDILLDEIGIAWGVLMWHAAKQNGQKKYSATEI